MSPEANNPPGSTPKHAPRRSDAAAGRRAPKPLREPSLRTPDPLPAKVGTPLRGPIPRLGTTLAATALLLLTGCGASRQVLRSDTSTQADTTATLRTATSEATQQHTATHTRQLNNTQTVVCVTEFDTSRPTDSATGTPPVKRRIVRTQLAATQTAQATTAAAQTQAATASQALASGTTRSDVHTEEQIRRGMTPLQRTLCVAGFAALVGLLIWLFTKLR